MTAMTDLLHQISPCRVQIPQQPSHTQTNANPSCFTVMVARFGPMKTSSASYKWLGHNFERRQWFLVFLLNLSVSEPDWFSVFEQGDGDKWDGDRRTEIKTVKRAQLWIKRIQWCLEKETGAAGTSGWFEHLILSIYSLPGLRYTTKRSPAARKKTLAEGFSCQVVAPSGLWDAIKEECTGIQKNCPPWWIKQPFNIIPSGTSKFWTCAQPRDLSQQTRLHRSVLLSRTMSAFFF